jgi:hypothetical protein
MLKRIAALLVLAYIDSWSPCRRWRSRPPRTRRKVTMRLVRGTCGAMGDLGSGCSRDDAVLLSRLRDHLPLRSQVIRLRQAWLGRAGPYDESALRRSQLFGAANFERTLRARRDSKGRVRRKESRAPVGRMSPGRARMTPADRSLPERRSPTYCFGNTGSTTGRCNGGRGGRRARSRRPETRR